jgi:hypothetical protein
MYRLERLETSHYTMPGRDYTAEIRARRDRSEPRRLEYVVSVWSKRWGAATGNYARTKTLSQATQLAKTLLESLDREAQEQSRYPKRKEYDHGT